MEMSRINASDVIGSYGGEIITRQGKVNENDVSAAELKSLKRSGKIECESCKNRRYQDGSNDPGVSFKTPTRISPGQSAEKVISHEREHYNRNNAKAARENKDVVSCVITTKKAVCSECGAVYTAGGQTRTVTREDKEKQENTERFSQDFFDKAIGRYTARNVDMLV